MDTGKVYLMNKRYFMLNPVLIRSVVSGLLLLLGLPAVAQSDTLTRRIVLIGDAGQLTNGRHPVVDAVKREIPRDEKTTILFLGDNLYKSGLPDEQYVNYAKARAVLDSQVSVADNTLARVYMIPGNHDWANGGKDGYNAILRQQLYVDFLGKKNVKYYPEDGCPGPKEIRLGPDAVVIAFDSQWWLHPYEKPEIESDCKCKTKEELVNQIEDLVRRNADKLVILACHHPFKSNGPHGGYFTFKQHLFPLTDLRENLYIPLPIIGSAYPIARAVFGSPQDIPHPNYSAMVREITEVVRRSSPNVVFVSGHDHNLQLIRDNNYHYIVSGGGCKQNRSSRAPNSLFNSRENGFAVLEVFSSKNVKLTFHEVLDTTTRSSAPFALLNFSSLSGAITAPVTTTTESRSWPDSITAPITRSHPPVQGLKKLFMGQNYRASWSQPVSMRVLDLYEENGGFTIESLGGGKQTRSLNLINKRTGAEWVLRNMNKNPSQAIREEQGGQVAEAVVPELKTSSFPYGAFIVPALTRPIGLQAAAPKLFFVPDDPALGIYRPAFGNSVCMLEPKNATPDGSDTRTTAKLLDKMLRENDHRPLQYEVLKARLLDLLIGDYDRHMDQWRWGAIDTGKGRLYYPIPRDRDQAFFYSDGLLLNILSGRMLPFLRGFRSGIDRVKWQGYIGRDFDRIFLNNLDRNAWMRAAAEIETALTDSVIRDAVHQLPPEIYRIEGDRITRKLIDRKATLSRTAITYYDFISREVNITGSNQKEFFRVSGEGNGLRVKVYARERGNDTSFTMYDRVFDPSVTREIRLFGLHDEDIFLVDSSARSPIKLRIIGGRGLDTFDIRGRVKTILYDLHDPRTGADYFIRDSQFARRRFSTTPLVNDRNLVGFRYNSTRFPRLHLNYNSDDGLIIGAGFSHRTQGFRNLPYATDQRLSALYAVDRGALRLRYTGEFNHVFGNTDLVIRAQHAAPALHNFFGLGNNTRIDERLPRRYYQTLFRYSEAEILFRRRLYDKLHLMGGPMLASYKASFDRNRQTILSKPAAAGLDSSSVFSPKSWAGGRFIFHLDNRNRDFFPTRGMDWRNEITAMKGLRGESNSYVAWTSDMSIYASLKEPAKMVAVLRFGGGRIYSRQFEYFQAMSIGAQQDLPGFRKQRYAGHASLYGGMELRMQLFQLNSYILPGPFGLSAFYHSGRVWQRNDPLGKGKWHGSYGFGVYFLPFNLFAISAYAGYSEQEKMLNFTLGTRINLTY